MKQKQPNYERKWKFLQIWKHTKKSNFETEQEFCLIK